MKKLLASLVGLTLLITLAGCILGPRDEKQAFIDATIKATCHIFEAENMFDPKLEEEAKAIYTDYGFPAEDQAKMQEIADNYAQDEAVKAAVMEGVKECSKGVPGLEGLQNLSVEEPVAEEPVVEEPVVEEPVVEEPVVEEPAAEVPAE